ncbi:putative ankyrin repeat protein [Powai lake megavirus]|uniref:Putative ankyrin repeat protein n=1 Tax=Powai lake megavirus TaxID=1842663 RepID=A0A167RMN5_9VIRU|nr:putative ankyrin repeat protein [Powai lake megavirus]ANB50884.1 putative ankyrin repeat protein [Powai lake megavirus]
MSNFQITSSLLQKTIINKDTKTFIEILEKCGEDDYWSITNYCRLYDNDQSMINIFINRVESGLIPISDKLILSASNINNIKLMDLLVNLGANINMDNSGNNPGIVLIQACTHGNIKLIEFLLQKGINPNCDNGKALIKACINKNLDTCKLLLDNGFIINYNDEKMMYWIIKLIKKKNIDAIQLLINHGFDFSHLNKYCESENKNNGQTIQMLLDCGIEAKNLSLFF